MSSLTPREIVSELDRHIVGQDDAKRAVAIALRNRWRRQQTPEKIRDEITPKNILMIGPTGVGKTEIARRLAKLAGAPFLKVEATKFTEVGYVGRDVDQIVRDLIEVGMQLSREEKRKDVASRAEANAEERILDALVGKEARGSTRESFRVKLRSGELDDKEVDIEMADSASPLQNIELPGGMGGQMGMISMSDLLGKAFAGRTKQVRMKVSEAHAPLVTEECDKLIDEEALVADAVRLVENDGIVFLDEVDKIAVNSEVRGGGVSREGVQRDLLPLIEGTTVSTKYGPVKSDHILFVASGAFHVSKPSDLLPELQGRLPILVELSALTKEDFQRILIEPEASLVAQYKALMATEGVTLDFTADGLEAVAEAAAQVNASVENIGARRLQTVMERLLDDLSFNASDRSGQSVTVDRAYVEERVAAPAGNPDLSKFIL